MRNVNLKFKTPGELQEKSFILTMRNVNSIKGKDSILNGIRFILTMRNVNKTNDKRQDGGRRVLS